MSLILYSQLDSLARRFREVAAEAPQLRGAFLMNERCDFSCGLPAPDGAPSPILPEDTFALPIAERLHNLTMQTAILISQLDFPKPPGQRPPLAQFLNFLSLRATGEIVHSTAGMSYTISEQIAGQRSEPIRIHLPGRSCGNWVWCDNFAAVCAGCLDYLMTWAIGQSPFPDDPATEIQWTTADGLSQWAKLFGFSVTTLKRRFKDGTIKHKKMSSKSYQIAVADLPAKHQSKFRNVGDQAAK
jgi:hypothetical protein